ncbi:hypothetical protein GCM10010329_30340 [Streptomyces spiroverticillatus]|uniref:DUF998 domain-containing protein n=1 Tax=Streptomyces finlayi TaxID=67296 RepID=A0A918WW28_9ACTN|nr:hypothetical protein [Streptomyces finlayi]GHA05775.1 hypothetical protein GCM10010329_30340 [Streptomyces spiroverticillatus]GHC89552.1 hypothetical protein GCM10010334_22750 [Streptomyces finlayi]
MPDWTYHPLRGLAAAVVGRRRSQRAALRLLASVGSRPAGARLISRGFGHRHPHESLAGELAGVPVSVRVGISVPPALARETVRAMAPLGAGVVEVTGVGAADVETVREAALGRSVPVVVRTDDPAVEAVLAPDVDGFTRGDDGQRVVRTSDPSVTASATALAEPGTVVLARPGVLVAAGPGWFQRVAEAATPTAPAQGLRDLGLDPRRWPAWAWALLLGLGMTVAGLGAAAITLGPVLLWYDRDYLGLTLDDLHAANHHLVHFLQHDRITMAGTMVAIGSLYIGLAWGGIRRGRAWAREAYLVSGAIGFPTLFYFLATGFVEPLHTATALVLFPMFVLGVRRGPRTPRWEPVPEGPERERRRALVGQLLLIVTGAGLFVGGAVISVVGLTGVFVPSDLTFLRTTVRTLESVSPQLVPFIAHDRAGFGGALMSAAAAIVLLSTWGWQRGEGWVFWSLAGAGAAGFLPAVFVHGTIHYTDFLHLAPVYFGIVLTATGLGLARPYLCAARATEGAQARVMPSR